MRTLLCFLLSLSMLKLSAQVKKYTLEECVLIALEKNISIQQSEIDLEGAR
jgi:outer membrane protein